MMSNSSKTTRLLDAFLTSLALIGDGLTPA